MPSRSQTVALLGLLAVALVFTLMPHFGAPYFRYTGSDPDHHVWNLGWPMVTCIYDSAHAPHFFVDPFAYVYGVVGILGFALVFGVLIVWNNRHRVLQSSNQVEAAP